MQRFIVLLLLVIGWGAQANTIFDSPASVSKWITYYYQNPEPAKVPAAIQYMSESGLLDDTRYHPPTFGFLAGVFKDNPDKVDDWLKQTRHLKEAHLAAVAIGLWYANLPTSQAHTYAMLDKHPALKESLSFLLTSGPMPVEQIPLEQGPWVLDLLWGNFMATGSPVPVLRIAESLPWLDVKGDVGRLLIGGAARWSLVSSATQHPRVLEICQQSVEAQSTEIASKLNEIIVEAKTAIQDRDSNQAKSTSQAAW